MLDHRENQKRNFSDQFRLVHVLHKAQPSFIGNCLVHAGIQATHSLQLSTSVIISYGRSARDTIDTFHAGFIYS